MIMQLVWLWYIVIQIVISNLPMHIFALTFSIVQYAFLRLARLGFTDNDSCLVNVQWEICVVCKKFSKG